MNQAAEISQEIINFLKKEEMYPLLAEITKLLQAEVYRSQDIFVLSATSLESAQKDKLSEILNKKWGEHRIRISIDPTLLSGIIIKFQDIIIDTSGKNDLVSLKQELN